MTERNLRLGDQALISPLPATGTGVPVVGATLYARIPPSPQAAEKSAPWFALQQRAPVDNAEHSAARLGITPEAGHDCRQGGIYVDIDYRGGYW